LRKDKNTEQPDTWGGLTGKAVRARSAVPCEDVTRQLGNNKGNRKYGTLGNGGRERTSYRKN